MQVEKTVFAALFFSGEHAKTKVLKICEAFGANNKRSKYSDEDFLSFHLLKKR